MNLRAHGNDSDDLRTFLRDGIFLRETHFDSRDESTAGDALGKKARQERTREAKKPEPKTHQAVSLKDSSISS